jgi:release factor glutamine methyltransferase
MENKSFLRVSDAADSLADRYTPTEFRHIARAFFSSAIDDYRCNEILHSWVDIPESLQVSWSEFLEKLHSGMPYQYALGFCDFADVKIEVNQSVLIPRPETEELIFEAIKRLPSQGRALDIGTGSGAIALALKKVLPNWEVHAIDVSAEACETARKNAALNQLDISVHQRDLLYDDLQDLPQLDLIISNPPYIPWEKKSEMEDVVVNHEPHLALFVPNDDPFVFYRKIANLAETKLRSGALLAFEIHYDGAKGVVDCLVEPIFTDIEIRKDINGHERFIFARKS